MLVLLVPSAPILYTYRKLRKFKLPLSFIFLRTIGVFPILLHYYEPLFAFNTLDRSKFKNRNLPGINFSYRNQLNFLSKLRFKNEIIKIPLQYDRKMLDSDFFLNNGSFVSADADFLYQFIRFTKPRNVIEIGSGHSTKLISMACAKNSYDIKIFATHTCIEPYEMPWLENLPGCKIIRKKVEDCNIDWNKVLSRGDLLFIDSSHIIRPQGDILKIYLEIIPQLQSGVYIHIHDIFSPNDYLPQWLIEEKLFWNEQYLLEAILSNNSRYEIISSLNFLKNNHFAALKKACPHLARKDEPGSFYIRIK